MHNHSPDDKISDTIMQTVAKNTFNFIIATDYQGERLDKMVVDATLNHFSDALSRSRVQKLIGNGMVKINNNASVSPKTRVKVGDIVTLTIPPVQDLVDVIPQDISLSIAYEDEHLIIVDKPAGMVVHPAPGATDGTLVNALLHYCGDQLSGINGVKRPGIVHRIDKDTTGLIVVAKNDETHTGLAHLFHEHAIERVYEAIVWGFPKPLHNTITGNIGRHRTQREKMAVVEAGWGKHAVTHYHMVKPLQAPNGTFVASVINCVLETGRTHQIRVHMSHVGHALIGDPVYGRNTPTRLGDLSEKGKRAVKGFTRQALHAKVLGFQHPITGEPIHCESNRPQDMQDLIMALTEPES